MGGGWSLLQGATVLANGSTRFSVWAPDVETASVVLVDGGRPKQHPLDRQPGGFLETVVPGVAAGADYFYRLDGERDRADPVSRHQPAGVHGPSRVVDPTAFRWSDADWRGIETPDLLIYELHVGTFMPEGSFHAVADRLPYLRELGVTAIELMPVAEFPGRRNWGYDGVHPYAPQSSYGGPDGLRRLVDAAHAEGLAVLLDVVYNHLGPEGNYLAEFGPYFTDRYGTPWGRALNFDGADSDQVRRYFIDNALYWVTEFHIDGLRLDAVQMIFDFSAYHILDELCEAVHRVASSGGRRVQVIAESDLNDPRLVREHGRSGYALDAMWNDDFHHAVHTALTGERGGYYVDFRGIESVARSLSDRFVLAGDYSAYRRRRHGASAVDLPADRFVVFIQNHDQVGNRARGERLSDLVSVEELKMAAAVLLLSPYVPLLFMGEEYGETNPFLYFVDHGDPALLEAVRSGRRREFAAFGWTDRVPDPGSEDTFLRSVLEPQRAQSPPHAQLALLYRDLIGLRKTEPALRPGAARLRIDSDHEAGWVAMVYEGMDHDLFVAHNFESDARSLPAALPAGVWTRRLATDDARYGGKGPSAPSRLTAHSQPTTVVELPGYTSVLYSRGVS